MKIWMKSVRPVGTTCRVYKDADRYVYVGDESRWRYFLQFMTAEDRIGHYRMYDRDGKMVAENLAIADIKKKVQHLMDN
ncbi:MAG: hypothetical protein KGQ58_02580 [Proteobacteria bacterium]|nr:hypothetical protein [Pseudomonadota bacterium]MDE3207492.1 hypothetical protein [Pseudomonadota bacterium]